MAESEEGLKSLLMKVKDESGKSWLNIQHSENKNGIRSHHFTGKRWETMETVTDFIFLGYKIIADGDCSMKLKDTCSLEEKSWQT